MKSISGNQPSEPLKNKRRGRPVTRTMPDPIPDTPENIMRALVGTPPKKKGEWDYLKRSKRVD